MREIDAICPHTQTPTPKKINQNNPPLFKLLHCAGTNTVTWQPCQRFSQNVQCAVFKIPTQTRNTIKL